LHADFGHHLGVLDRAVERAVLDLVLEDEPDGESERRHHDRPMAVNRPSSEMRAGHDLMAG